MKRRGRFAEHFVTGSLKFQLLSRSLLVMSVLLLLIGVFQYIFMQQFLYKNKAETIRNQLATLPPNTWQRAGESPDRGQNPFMSRRDINGGIRSDNSGGECPRIFVHGLAIAVVERGGT